MSLSAVHRSGITITELVRKDVSPELAFELGVALEKLTGEHDTRQWLAGGSQGRGCGVPAVTPISGPAVIDQ